jgi:hypothetical protein
MPSDNERIRTLVEKADRFPTARTNSLTLSFDLTRNEDGTLWYLNHADGGESLCHNDELEVIATFTKILRAMARRHKKRLTNAQSKAA